MPTGKESVAANLSVTPKSTLLTNPSRVTCPESTREPSPKVCFVVYRSWKTVAYEPSPFGGVQACPKAGTDNATRAAKATSATNSPACQENKVTGLPPLRILAMPLLARSSLDPTIVQVDGAVDGG